MEVKTIDCNGKKLQYTIYGNGKPVMLVHGFGEDDSVWKNQVDFLQDRFQLIVPQLPGTGNSELWTETSMETLADALKQIADAEKLHSFTLIGHSMGGYTTLAFAEKYPTVLQAFGLFHSSAYADTEEKKATREKGIAFIKQHGAREFLKTTTPNLFSSITKNERPDLVKSFLENAPVFSDEALIAYYEAMMKRKDRTNILSESKVPVLFIMGEHDQSVLLEDSLKQSSMPPVSDIHILKRSAHMGMLEETGKSNEALESFLSAI